MVAEKKRILVTIAQHNVYEGILSFWRKHFRAPSQYELAGAIGVSRRLVNECIGALTSKGLVSQAPSMGVGAGAGTLKPTSLKVKFTGQGGYLFW
jgi:hypothetical protein